MNMIPEKISTRFRIGIIGPGSICVTYGNALKASDTVSLACICGRDTEKGRKTAERFQVPYYTDQEQMYRNEALDGVLICTPTYTHEEMVRRALARRGWSPTFICESAGTQAEDALEMQRIYQSYLV